MVCVGVRVGVLDNVIETEGVFVLVGVFEGVIEFVGVLV